jgi:hypothetical protein
MEFREPAFEEPLMAPVRSVADDSQDSKSSAPPPKRGWTLP